MPPSSDGDVRMYTVGCSFERLVPDASHVALIRDAVARTHRITILATELLNLYVRERLQHHDGANLESIFDSNWLVNAYNEVSNGTGHPKIVAELRDVRERLMPNFDPPSRSKLTQILKYQCDNIATVATTNVWKHFHRRIMTHVREVFTLSKDAYDQLSRDARKHRKLSLMHVAEDLTRPPSESRKSPSEYHEWITAERRRLVIDDAVGEWGDKPLLYHLKARPEKFLVAMHRMSAEREARGRSAFALFPLRRTMVPRHIRLDQKALRALLGLGESEHSKMTRKRKRQQSEQNEPTPRVQRRSKADLHNEKAEVFAEVLDLRAAKVRQSHRFDFSLTTDGICARLQYVAAMKGTAALEASPKRGMWSIDALKNISRQELHVIGVDPGKREIIVAVDQDAPQGSTVRYTQAQRQRELNTLQYRNASRRDRPIAVRNHEAALSLHNSRSADLETFRKFCAQRRDGIDAALAYYEQLEHRRRRWKGYIKAQQSEERLCSRLRAMHSKDDSRTLIIAYGSWGLVAGHPGAPCNRGNPPTIGVGMMRRLARRFVIVPTPEQFTSKTCCKCLHPCGPWVELEEKEGRKIRGLRVCQNEECRMPQNRDRTGADNIGKQFLRLHAGHGPLRSMTKHDLELNRLRCLQCD